MRFVLPLTLASFVFQPWLFAQDDTTKQRQKEARELSRGGSEVIPRLAPLLSDASPEVRREAVKSIVAIGTQHSVSPLLEATRDSDPDIQFRAVDGIVNFYLPGYVSTSRIARVGAAIRNQLDRENWQVVDPSVAIPEPVVTAIGKVITGGVSLESRTNAARAVGVLRGKSAVPYLVEALRSKNSPLIYESLVALQKIGDLSAGPRVAFLLRDFEEPVQIAAIETTGLLQNRQAIPDLQKVYAGARNDRVREKALAALSMLPEESTRDTFKTALAHKNDRIRAAGLEGLARLKSPADKPALEKGFNEETKMAPRLAAAFGLVLLGDVKTEEMSPLTYLVNALNSKAYRGVAEPYLVEAAREPVSRTALQRYIFEGNTLKGTPAEKMGLGRVLAASGNAENVPLLQALSKDPNTEVAQEGVRSLRNLRSRLP